MSLLDRFTDNNSKLESKEIAADMLKDSKYGITSLASATAEAVNPQLRNMLGQQLDKAVTEHFELTDMVIKKGWYPAFDEPIEQIRKEYNEAQNII